MDHCDDDTTSARRRRHTVDGEDEDDADDVTGGNVGEEGGCIPLKTYEPLLFIYFEFASSAFVRGCVTY